MNKKFLLILNLILISCCVFSQKEANTFLNNQREKTKREIIYLIPSTELIRTNITTLDSVDDTIVLGIFTREIVNSLEFYGFEVRQVTFNPTILKDNEHTLEITQAEIEEYSFYDSIKDDYTPELKFYKQLNGVRINIWLTYNKQKQEDKLIFYNEEQITDGMEGYFETENSKQTYVNYEIVPINPNDVYLISFANARKCAEYFFNFLLNRYVYIHTGGKDNNFYSISPQRTLLKSKYPFTSFDIIQ